MKLNISERLYVIRILNDFKGSLDKLAVILEDIKQLPIIDDEWAAAEREIIPEGENVSWKWDDARGGEKEINLQKETKDYLYEIMKKKNDAGEFGIADRVVIGLFGKLK